MRNSKKKTSVVRYLAIWGCISTGILYAAIGVIAILSFLKLKKGGADEASFLVFLDKFIVGKLFIWVIMLGMVCYIIWRIYETINDPYGYGKDLKGVARRIGTALSSFADGLIAYSAIQALLGIGGILETGQPTAEREMAGKMLRENWGNWVLMLMGIITSVTAIVQFIYTISKGYLERMNIGRLDQWKKTGIHVLAWAGHFARGIILGIIGFFFIKATLSKNAQYVVNTDKAFDFIGDDVGHLWFIVVAIGTICYGLFMLAFGAYYDADKD